MVSLAVVQNPLVPLVASHSSCLSRRGTLTHTHKLDQAPSQYAHSPVTPGAGAWSLWPLILLQRLHWVPHAHTRRPPATCTQSPHPEKQVKMKFKEKPGTRPDKCTDLPCIHTQPSLFTLFYCPTVDSSHPFPHLWFLPKHPIMSLVQSSQAPITPWQWPLSL